MRAPSVGLLPGWSSCCRTLNVMLLFVVASPLFYAGGGRERVSPLRVVAAAATQPYMAANEEAGGHRNLTVKEHLLTALLTPAIFIRSRNTTVESYHDVLVDAIPLMACGRPASFCNPQQLSWWDTMEHKELMLLSSWLVAMNAVFLPFSATRHGAAIMCSTFLLGSLIVFGGICLLNRCTPTPQYAATLLLTIVDAMHAHYIPKSKSTLLQKLVSSGADTPAAASAEQNKKQKPAVKSGAEQKGQQRASDKAAKKKK